MVWAAWSTCRSLLRLFFGALLKGGNMNAREIAAALGSAKETTNGWIACCPVATHGKGRGDCNPSLSLANGANGEVVPENRTAG